jgi:hypothetical protein
MSYLFPLGTETELGVLQVGSNINVDGNSVISVAQSLSPTANITFNNITASDNLNVGGSLTVINGIATTGNISGSAVFDNGNRVVTSVLPTANVGISLSNVVTSGPNAGFRINNTGVLSLVAGTGIAVSGSTGNITISATGATVVNTKGVNTNYTLTGSDNYVGATVGSITLTLPAGIVGQSYILKNEGGSGACTVAATGPDTIDGSATKSLNSNASITVIYRAGAWRII